MSVKMDVDLLFKIAAIGILVAVLHQVLCRAGREEQAMMTTLAGVVIVLTLVIKEISTLFNTVRTLFNIWFIRLLHMIILHKEQMGFYISLLHKMQRIDCIRKE